MSRPGYDAVGCLGRCLTHGYVHEPHPKPATHREPPPQKYQQALNKRLRDSHRQGKRKENRGAVASHPFLNQEKADYKAGPQIPRDWGEGWGDPHSGRRVRKSSIGSNLVVHGCGCDGHQPWAPLPAAPPYPVSGGKATRAEGTYRGQDR